MKNYRYDGSKRFNIKSFDCADTGEFKERHEAIREFTENLEQINEYQQKLFAEQKEGIIFVFQAMDAAGKDGAVRAVLSCLSPQGVSEHSFKVPSAEENRHDYLWRFWDALPEKGCISIFNRSYYEDVLVQKIHKYYENNKYADRIDTGKIIDQRYEQIRNFEKYLWENSIRVVKIFLNVSKEEQGKRFISRIDTPKKNWKFSSGDIDERAYWDEYMEAFETCINRTARKNTPWYVVPADHKWYARLVISRIVLGELKAMDPKWPVLDDQEMAKLASYREMLVKELGKEDFAEDATNTGEKLKPSDTAVGIALKSDRQALSEKKFKKLLKRSVFDSFCERFGVSEQTQEALGKVYLKYEEQEAAAENDGIGAVKEYIRSQKNDLQEKLEGCGKEGRKLLNHFRRDAKDAAGSYEAAVSLRYAAYEDKLKQYMNEYELSISTEEAEPEEALAAYEDKVSAAFETLRGESAEALNESLTELDELFAVYEELAESFIIKQETEEASSETAPEESDESAEAEEAEAAAPDADAVLRTAVEEEITVLDETEADEAAAEETQN